MTVPLAISGTPTRDRIPARQQNRIEHPGMVHAVEDDRSPLGGDAPGEAAAHRDAHALADFLLQPARRGRDQLPGATVKEQHRRGVGLQYLLRPVQQLDQEILGVKVR